MGPASLTLVIGNGTALSECAVLVAFWSGNFGEICFTTSVVLTAVGSISNTSVTVQLPSSGSFTVYISGSNFGFYHL